jgi:hypothetical protein
MWSKSHFYRHHKHECGVVSMGPIFFVHRKCAKIENACQQHNVVVGGKKALDKNLLNISLKKS